MILLGRAAVTIRSTALRMVFSEIAAMGSF
jgi:hypothetical protein